MVIIPDFGVILFYFESRSISLCTFKNNQNYYNHNYFLKKNDVCVDFQEMHYLINNTVFYTQKRVCLLPLEQFVTVPSIHTVAWQNENSAPAFQYASNQKFSCACFGNGILWEPVFPDDFLSSKNQLLYLTALWGRFRGKWEVLTNFPFSYFLTCRECEHKSFVVFF